MVQSSSITVSVPGTSANLGPGYDCVGLALGIHNRVTVQRKDEEFTAAPRHPMVEDVATRFFSQPEVSTPRFGFSWSIEGEVPRSRGMGSSVTVRLGVLMGLNALSGSPLSSQKLFEVCSEAEGHPDNVGPAVFGGFVLANGSEYVRFEVAPELKAVLLVPDLEVDTADARSALPESVPHRDAARNTANACLLVAAFATQKYGLIAGALDDFLHQPYRKHLVPGLFESITAGVHAGAIGGYLSGSGSTIACLAIQNYDAVAEAMLQAVKSFGITGRTLVVDVDTAGAQIVT